jgi:hypothetical protein
MKLAIIGSRNIKKIIIDDYIPENVSEIVSGGAKGIDSLAKEYAIRKGIKLTEFLPEYKRYGRAAPIIRNKRIVEDADKIIVFWDGCSNGARSVILYAQKIGKPCEVILNQQ